MYVTQHFEQNIEDKSLNLNGTWFANPLAQVNQNTVFVFILVELLAFNSSLLDHLLQPGMEIVIQYM